MLYTLHTFGRFYICSTGENKIFSSTKTLAVGMEWIKSASVCACMTYKTVYLTNVISLFLQHTVLENGYNHTALTHDKKTVVKWLADFGFFVVVASFCFCPFRLWNNPYRRHTQSLKQTRHFVEHYSLRWFARRHCCWPCRANRQNVALCYAAGYVLVYSLRSPPKQPQIRMAGHRSRDTQSTPHLCLQK